MSYYNLNFEYEDLEEIDGSSLIDNNDENNDDEYNENVIYEIIEVLLSLIYDYVEENPSMLSCHDIDQIIIDKMFEIVDIMLEDIKFDNYVLFLDYEKYIEELELIEFSFDLYNSMFHIKHSHIDNELDTNKDDFVVDVDFIVDSNLIEKMEAHIDYLRSKPQPEQRTNDWYKFRHNLLTASNAHKALSTQSAMNNLICEKCQPLKQIDPENPEVVKSVNINSPLHHGQKYEPLSVMLYEQKYDTKVEDFGCIQHDNYDFIGASPDGINVDKSSPLFGRMLEIKNVVSRLIDGIPKKEYWIQMQLQMEVCDLDYCDFLETKFVEYDSENDYKLDNESTKGIILYFSNGTHAPYYLYQPLGLNEEDSEKWVEEHIENLEENMTWIKTIYWKLETYSCILVERNRSWFDNNVGQFENVWNIILKERVEGHEHRLPKKRVKKIDAELELEIEIQKETQKQTSIEGFCLLKK
jgi:putative phage-type endonuclease